jgi:hypothetical protein
MAIIRVKNIYKIITLTPDCRTSQCRKNNWKSSLPLTPPAWSKPSKFSTIEIRLGFSVCFHFKPKSRLHPEQKFVRLLQHDRLSQPDKIGPIFAVHVNDTSCAICFCVYQTYKLNTSPRTPKLAMLVLKTNPNSELAKATFICWVVLLLNMLQVHFAQTSQLI